MLINQETRKIWSAMIKTYSSRRLEGSKRNFMQRNQRSSERKERERGGRGSSVRVMYVRIPSTHGCISCREGKNERVARDSSTKRREKRRDGGWERAQIQRTRGADKNVARTGDITGSNVTRSRRPSSPVGVQGRKRVIKRRTLHEEIETHPRHGARITIINNYNWFAVVPWST